MVSKYLDAHYGQPKLGVKNFPITCIEEVGKHLSNRPTRRALDIGCATGRASFELARIFDHVDAVDFSARLLATPTSLQKSGRLSYLVCQEGELSSYREIRLEEFKGYSEIKGKIAFMQGDACNLLEIFKDYDLVFAGNLLSRLYDPAKFLELIKNRIRPKGLLVLASSYTWQENYTPRDKWLGGFKGTTGENVTSLAGITQVLSPQFTLINEPKDIPFVIRETARKFQYGVSELTVWEKCSE